MNFYHGRGVKQDFEQAARYFHVAADLDFDVASTVLGDDAAVVTKSQYALGLMSEKGQGVPRDIKEAERFYRLAAAQGHPEARDALAELNRNASPAEPVRPAFDRSGGDNDSPNEESTERSKANLLWYSQQDCDADTAFMWFQQYQKGSAAVAQDNYEAGRWLRRAAEKGHAVAQCTVGVILLESPHSTKADRAQGVSWLKKAAYQGDAKAQFLVALSYEEGKGVEKDLEKAVEWCRKAAAQGLKQAQEHQRAKGR
jgi:TPR repeat protein